MVNYQIDSAYIRGGGYGSLGMTNKYYKDGYWYKQNCSGYEGKSEALCSMILSHSNIEEYVHYEECTINGLPGCRSKNFTSGSEQVVTFHKLFQMSTGRELAEEISLYSNVNDRIKYVLDFISRLTGLNVRQYLCDTLYFDMLTLNVDRHFSNLAVIRDLDRWKIAPLFDFGASFFSLQHVFGSELTLQQKLEKMTPKPFSGNFEAQAAALGECRIRIDYDAVYEEMRNEDSGLKELIRYQLEKYKSVMKQGTF